MLLIYSIGRSHARHQISFPSVFCHGDGDWTVPCGGAEIIPETDYLVFGEVKTLGGRPFLAIEKAVSVVSLPYFVRVFGNGGEEGVLEGGLRVEGSGDFAGELVAVDQSLLVVLGQERGASEEVPSPASRTVSHGEGLPHGVKVNLEGGADALKGETATPKIPEVNAQQVCSTAPPLNGKVSTVSNNDAAKHLKPIQSLDESVRGGPERKENRESPTPQKTEKTIALVSKDNPRFTGDSGVSGGAGEGVPGTIITVLSVPDQEFPEAGPMPELAGVKRSELARKADARKKNPVVAVKPEKNKAAVSSGGIKLGRDLGGDKKVPLVQNSIDEDELW